MKEGADRLVVGGDFVGTAAVCMFLICFAQSCAWTSPHNRQYRNLPGHIGAAGKMVGYRGRIDNDQATLVDAVFAWATARRENRLADAKAIASQIEVICQDGKKLSTERDCEQYATLRLRAYAAWVLANERMWRQAFVNIQSMKDSYEKLNGTICLLSVEGRPEEKAPLKRLLIESLRGESVSERAIILRTAACALQYSGDNAGSRQFERDANDMWTSKARMEEGRSLHTGYESSWKVYGALLAVLKDDHNNDNVQRRLTDALVSINFDDMDALQFCSEIGIQDCFLGEVRLAVIHAIAVRLSQESHGDERMEACTVLQKINLHWLSADSARCERDTILYKLGCYAFGVSGGEILSISIFEKISDIGLRDQGFSFIAPELAQIGRGVEARYCLMEIFDRVLWRETAQEVARALSYRIIPNIPPPGINYCPPLPSDQRVGRE